TVTPEDARGTYTGLIYVTTASASGSTATVVLSATVQDITAVPGDPSYDPYAGDVRNAKVTFINRDTGAVIAANVPVGLGNAADGAVYQCKRNAIDSLNITSPRTGVTKATYTGKANVTDITDPLNPVSLGGNKLLQVQMTDNGEPGTADTIAITLSDPAGGLL